MIDELEALKADLTEADKTIARMVEALAVSKDREARTTKWALYLNQELLATKAERDKYRDLALKLDTKLAAQRPTPPSDIAPSFSLNAHAEVGFRRGV